MNKRVKAEFIIIKGNKYFLEILGAILILIGYNIFSAATEMETGIEGGYYSYTIMTLSYLIGVIIPMSVGAFLGGYDEKSKMMEYKLSSQTSKQWFLARGILIIKCVVGILFAMNLVGMGLDLCRGTMSGKFVSNMYMLVGRFFPVMLVWMFWAAFSFCISLYTKSPGNGIFYGIILFFVEQYIEQYVKIPWGILWNLKSLEHEFFCNDTVPFGVVQASYNSFAMSFCYIIFLGAICIGISWKILRHRYYK